MNDYESKVREFHLATGCAIDAPYSKELLALRERLLAEEFDELKAEFAALAQELAETGTTKPETCARMLKEMADLQYVLSGAVVALGLPLEEAFARVHQSNMSKLVNGKPLLREDGKILKGPNYHPPVLDDLV
jgi:predicted HAD superfamily Cof-like phosphohydrolase